MSLSIRNALSSVGGLFSNRRGDLLQLAGVVSAILFVAHQLPRFVSRMIGGVHLSLKAVTSAVMSLDIEAVQALIRQFIAQEVSRLAVMGLVHVLVSLVMLFMIMGFFKVILAIYEKRAIDYSVFYKWNNEYFTILGISIILGLLTAVLVGGGFLLLSMVGIVIEFLGLQGVLFEAIGMFLVLSILFFAVITLMFYSFAHLTVLDQDEGASAALSYSAIHVAKDPTKVMLGYLLLSIFSTTMVSVLAVVRAFFSPIITSLPSIVVVVGGIFVTMFFLHMPASIFYVSMFKHLDD